MRLLVVILIVLLIVGLLGGGYGYRSYTWGPGYRYGGCVIWGILLVLLILALAGYI
jgi:hypothetical protein